jgi:hypothetical protein
MSIPVPTLEHLRCAYTRLRETNKNQKEEYKMKPAWNYRLMLDNSGKKKIFSFHEVFYDDGDDKPSHFTKMPETMMSEEAEELLFKIEGFLSGFEKPVLSINRFPQEVHDEDL